MKEEEEGKDKGKDIATGGVELLSRVQELEDELKVSENNRWDLIHGNTALQIKLKASREEVDHVRQEMINLENRLLTVQSTQVRKILCLMHLHSHL